MKFITTCYTILFLILALFLNPVSALPHREGDLVDIPEEPYRHENDPIDQGPPQAQPHFSFSRPNVQWARERKKPSHYDRFTDHLVRFKAHKFNAVRGPCP